MTKAEDKAQAYENSLDYCHYTSDNPSVAYKAGYEQAEKDLALTWEDIREIVQMADKMLDDPEARIAYQNHNEEYYYKKVLESWKRKCHL